VASGGHTTVVAGEEADMEAGTEKRIFINEIFAVSFVCF
jgi:hypothetical protein